MRIELNNRDEIFENKIQIKVKELLKLKNFTFPMIIIKINGKLVKKSDYSDSVIKDGDKVAVVHLISGG